MAAPGAAWLYFMGMIVPSANAVVERVIGGICAHVKNTKALKNTRVKTIFFMVIGLNLC
jgi:hypothetical protein